MSFSLKLSPVLAAVRSGQGVTQQIMWIAGFAFATALGARVEIPHEPVPFTLQTFVVLLAGAFLGPRNGAISQVAYLTAGLLGAPVFSGGGFGLERLLGPTGGYLLAFPMAAAVAGYLTGLHRSFVWTLLSMAAGLLVIFVSGTIQLYTLMFRNWGDAFSAGFLIFSWWDLAKLAAAAVVYHKSV